MTEAELSCRAQAARGESYIVQSSTEVSRSARIIPAVVSAITREPFSKGDFGGRSSGRRARLEPISRAPNE